MYLWGNIALYVISYYYHFGGKEGTGEGVSMYDTVIVIPAITCMLAIVNPTGAYLYRRVPVKVLIGLGSCLGVLAMIFASMSETFTLFLMAFCALYGLGIGLCYFPPLACGWEWLPDSKGLVTGVVLGAFGFGAFVFSFVA